MRSRTLLPPNASAEAAVSAIPSRYVPAIHSSHVDSRVPGLTFARKLPTLVQYPQNESSPPPCLPAQQPHSPGRRLKYPDWFPSPSPPLSRSSTSLDRLGYVYIAIVSSPKSQGWHLWFLAWFLASNEDPAFRPSVFTFTPSPSLNVHKFPQPKPQSPSTPPPRSSQPPYATVDAELIREQQGREKRQRCNSVGSVAASDSPQEAPACKSCLRPNGKLLPWLSLLNGFDCKLRLSAVSRSLVTRGHLLYRARGKSSFASQEKRTIPPSTCSHTIFTNKFSITGTTAWQFK
ncbi:hypothetical protein EDB85DRAFT_1899449 [Lactarius pseudohatsudake]|nr:hypothetical protein EDB85DRAFT_1899449 [Lactarius pseudohatsudake]